MLSKLQKKIKYRSEIDGLRGIAIIAVIINHFNKVLLPNGYLGVDIFFVISGYVITASLENRDSKNFLDFITTFYERRIKRLFPALIFFIIIITLLNLFFNPSPNLSLKTGATSLLGFSNLYLFKNATDYFAQSTQLNVYTHTWSLSVEEQFYFIFPIIIWFSGFSKNLKNGSRNLFFIIFFFSITSLILFINFNSTNQPAAYFLMPSRFWEISAGCLTYLLFSKKQFIKNKLKQIPDIYTLILILMILILPVDFALISTISIVSLTSIFLLSVSSESLTYRLLTQKNILSIGKMSYSLYLWHWGILAISRWTIGIHWWSIPFQLLLIYLISYFSFNFIENPFRKKEFFKFKSSNILIGVLVNILLSFSLFFIAQKHIARIIYLPKILGIKEAKMSWGDLLDCHGKEDIKKIKKPFYKCLKHERNKETSKRFYLIGDSHSAQWFFMLEQALKNTDYSLGFINTENNDDFPSSFQKRENAVVNSKTITEILKYARSKDIVAISFYREKLNSVNNLQSQIINKLARKNYLDLTEKLYEKGVTILLIGDTPKLNEYMEISTCEMQEKFIGWNACSVSKEEDKKNRQLQDNLFNYLRNNSKNVYIWDPREEMLIDNEKYSYVSENGERVMNDFHHITKDYSLTFISSFKNFFETIILD